MDIKTGDIVFFNQYFFTDSGENAKHYALVLLPKSSTKYQNSLLCCVITSKKPRKYEKYLMLYKKAYSFFAENSFVCFDRKDLQPISGLDKKDNPRGKLNILDYKKAFKALKASLFTLDDIANSLYLRGTIIREWKKNINN